MLKFFQDIKKQKIVAIDENEEVGRFFDFLFNYDNGQVLAIIVKKSEFFKTSQTLLLPRDVLKWGQNIYIREVEDLSLPEEIVRLKNYQTLYFSLINIPVFTENKKKIGHVIDYAISDIEFCLKKICVGNPGIPFFTAPTLITEIGRDRIISISRNKVIVKSLIVKDTETELTPNYLPELSC